MVPSLFGPARFSVLSILEFLPPIERFGQVRRCDASSPNFAQFCGLFAVPHSMCPFRRRLFGSGRGLHALLEASEAIDATYVPDAFAHPMSASSVYESPSLSIPSSHAERLGSGGGGACTQQIWPCMH